MSTGARAKEPPPLADAQFDVGSTADSLERMIGLFARYGDIYRVFVPSRRSYSYVVHHPDDVKHVLVSNHRNYVKGGGVERIKLLLGNGIMTSEGDLWTRQRYMMQPLFHRRVVARFGQVIDEVNDRFIARWDTLCGSAESLNLTDEMSELTLEIVLRSILGTDLDALTQRLGGNPFELLTKDPARNLDFVIKFRSLTKLLVGLIAARRSQGAEHFDFLGMLMNARDKESGKGMSEGELINEIMTLIIAGHETTASGLNWTWYLLSQHPEVAARLQAEIDATPSSAAPSLTQMEDLTYTLQVVNETLRLYPPGWLLYRRTINADSLGGYAVPAETDVLLPLYLTHRHPKFWEHPNSFRPERFAAGTEAQRPRYAYVPFAAGPRHCIGETLALYEMLMHVFKAARHFKFTYVADKPIELEAGINLRTRYPLHMRIERR
jgi:enediyne biosynthesis protein E7